MDPAAPVDEVTETVSGGSQRRSSGASPDPGLVLLYADPIAGLPPAFVFERDVEIVGRERGAASIVIPQRAVSRVHARIARSREGFTIRDLGSHNGVFVNGRAVEAAPLAPGVEVCIGRAIFKFVPSDARAYAQYPLDGPALAGARPVTIPGAVGGFRMARVSTEVDTIAASDMPVLVLGETGTGKELVAQALHARSGRRGTLRALNCAAIPEALVESELFGYKRGAFSGATRDQVGIVRAAHGGTLLLDEIGDMPLDAQAKLLRVLETREVVPVGAVAGERVDVRVVAATHQDLRALVSTGRFRADLYARINGYTLTLPPLRDRKEDIHALVRHFLRKHGEPDRGLTFELMQAVCRHGWPYNVRELGAAVKRALTVSEGAALDAAHLPDSVLEPGGSGCVVDPGARSSPPSGPAPRMRRPDRARFEALLSEHRGNLAAVARSLGRDRALIHRWLRELGIDPESYRQR